MIVGIIPARFNSSRFKGKLMAKIRGKPLIEYTYRNALKCSILDELIVATDHPDIHSHISACGGRAIFTSPNCPNGTERAAEVIKKERSLMNADVVALIQGDEPCIEPEVIESSIEALIKTGDASVGTAIKMIKKEEISNPHLVKCVIDLSGYALYFSRSPIPGKMPSSLPSSFSYFGHIGIYTFRPNFLLNYPSLKPTPLQIQEDLEQLKILEHGYKIITALVKSDTIGVDTPEDLKRIEPFL